VKDTVTDKQKKFADEYLIDCNATQAAIRAGYSEKTARQIGQENLSKPDIQYYIHRQLKKQHDDTIADAKEVMEYLTSVMRGELSEDTELTVRDRLKAAELIGKRYSLWTEKVEVETGEKGVTINIDIPKAGPRHG
jgi:phage terminase small subunit